MQGPERTARADAFGTSAPGLVPGGDEN